MEYETVPARDFGHALRATSVNLLCRDVPAEVAFLTTVFGMTAHRVSRDFAILLHADQPLQLHSDAAYASHPLPSLLPEAGPRGAGVEIRLHEADPDKAAARTEEAGGVVLQPPTDKPGHGLREAVILSPSGYAFVPSRRI
ncbi:VOC family protein [Tabrizicola oligotrophica]|uniref:Glyoxalase n=1 Tax=Tabrizicola oligotrophica TaxID=2710650 RepID=A0A6M0QSM4_9RHOB|nr:VOC family protein [Tabrizicola oligotrophica]NEY89991.1 glyoxalase [Tabrizicola oligotrophica]